MAMNPCYLCRWNEQDPPDDYRKVSYHRFPVDLKLRERWFRACGLSPNVDVTYTRICSLHFSDECYYNKNAKLSGQRRLLLKANAVPTIALRSPQQSEQQSEPKPKQDQVTLVQSDPKPNRDQVALVKIARPAQIYYIQPVQAVQYVEVETDNESDTKKTCRICLQEADDECVNLFEDEGQDILEKIRIISSVQLEYIENVSAIVCKQCVEYIKLCNNFRQLIIESNRHIISSLEEGTEINQDNVDDILENENDVGQNVDNDEPLEIGKRTGKRNYNRQLIIESNKHILSSLEEGTEINQDNVDDILDNEGEAGQNVENDEPLEIGKRIGKRNYNRQLIIESKKDIISSLEESKEVNEDNVDDKLENENDEPPEIDKENRKEKQKPDEPPVKRKKWNCFLTPDFLGICYICGARVRRDNLRSHLQIHSNEKQKCSECGFVSKNPQSLRHHIAYNHRERKYVCQFCGKDFGLYSVFTRHLHYHQGPRTKCKLCNATMLESNLEKHMSIHNGEKGHFCSYCKKGYASNRLLLNHIRRIHKAKKPYYCKYCDTAFALSGLFRKHMKESHAIRVISTKSAYNAGSDITLSIKPANYLTVYENSVGKNNTM